ncbi:MAG: hypothetical protein HY717_02010 [Planctomycetes bacterium]|nr:hypothetical protein [Planctomycetota bacterium]
MTIEKLRQLYTARPFQPFILHMADGRQVAVHHPEFLAISPSGRTVIVSLPDEAFEIVDLLLVTDLEVRPPAGASAGAT